ncbi:MAG TPA: thermonuclease family protein [Thermoplasmata archaeon]|nr:thermonuclease family protein [Thermoplasmata archaeon]
MVSRRRATILIVIVVAVVVVAAVFAASRLPIAPASGGNSPPTTTPNPTPSACPRSEGLCVERNVTRVIDGDTLDVEGSLRIRLVLVNAPELNASGGPESRDYLTGLCSGSLALVDEDDFQIGHDPYGRVLAVVYCGSTNANAAMISSGHATTYYAFCSVSEFGTTAWSGCASPPPPPPGNCDPAYPDVCIPPPPPDLDCSDIPYRNFRVLPPDPHHFDGDGDGIGCEA